jgi:cytochrome c-type biogenesis protein CcmH
VSVRAFLVVAVLALLLAAPATASERHPTLAELSHEVMCPTCKQLLELSHAPVADRIRAFIKTRIAAGDTKSEIKQRLVSEFGEAVLASPPRQGFDLLAWLLPLLGLAGSATVVAAIVWRWRGHSAAAPDDEPADPELARRLDEELALLDA